MPCILLDILVKGKNEIETILNKFILWEEIVNLKFRRWLSIQILSNSPHSLASLF